MEKRHFRKLPVVVTAEPIQTRIEIPTREGTMIGNPGDWLITGIAGEQYACKPDIFDKTYEEVVWNDVIGDWVTAELTSAEQNLLFGEETTAEA